MKLKSIALRNRKPIVMGVLLLVVYAAARLWIQSRPMPTNLGVQDGQLAECPESPNCVSSQAANPNQAMPPIPRPDATGSDGIARIVDRIRQMPRARIVRREPNYLHVEVRSLIMGFVDDVEFYAPPDQPVIHFRSASRLGHSDLGVNRQRMEQFVNQ